MYMTEHFEETDRSRLLALIRSSPLAVLVINGRHGIEANHLPFIYRDRDQSTGLLCAHIPRANPLGGMIEDGTRCLVIFVGPQGYVSPTWYATKKEHGRVVPTWNYSVVHAHGRVRLVEDGDWVRQQLEDLTNQMELQRQEPWSTADAPEDFRGRLINSLVGLEVTIERLVGKTKASQNQPGENQASVLEALNEEQPDSAFAALMRSVLGHR